MPIVLVWTPEHLFNYKCLRFPSRLFKTFVLFVRCREEDTMQSTNALARKWVLIHFISSLPRWLKGYFDRFDGPLQPDLYITLWNRYQHYQLGRDCALFFLLNVFSECALSLRRLWGNMRKPPNPIHQHMRLKWSEVAFEQVSPGSTCINQWFSKWFVWF